VEPPDRDPNLVYSGVVAERRRHSRGRSWDAMSFEISESGLSLATTEGLTVGEELDLSPVAGRTVKAIVRRQNGSMHGVEFIEMGPDLRDKILKLCEGLPLFRTMADV